MRTQQPKSPEQDLLLNILARIQWRERVNLGLRDLLFGCGILGTIWIGLQWLAVPPAARISVTLLAVFGLACFFGWRWARLVTLARSAATADRRAELDDEMKSAFSFVRGDRVSPWVDLHIQRASQTASELDGRELVPIVVPKRLVLFNAALLVLGIVLWPVTHKATPIGSENSSRSQLADQVRNIEEMLQPEDVEGDMESSEDENRRADTLQRLDDTLRRLEEGELPLSEGLEALAETQNEMTEAGLDAAALQDALNDVARDLEGEGIVGELAEALQQGRLEEAVELLKALAEQAGSSEEMDPSLERLKDAESRSASLEEWMDALKKAAEALEQGDSAEAENRFAEAAEELESMNAEMKSNRQMSLAGQQLEELRDALSRDAQLRRLSEQQQASAQELQPLDEDAQALAEALADLPAPEDQSGGNPDGLPMGPAAGAEPPPPPEESETLEFQLEREMLGEEEEPEEPDPEELIERASREQESEIEYAEVERNATYREADVMSPEPIPWRYRQIIKSYFETIQRKTKP